MLISNKSLIDEKSKRRDIMIINAPLTDMASRLGNTRCANMIAAGIYIKRSKTLSLKNAVEALKNMLKNKEDLFILNKKALEKGHGI